MKNRIGHLILVSLFSLFAACTKKAEEPLDTLRLHLEDEPPTLDWNVATDMTSRLVLLNIMEPLLDYEFDSDGRPQLVENLLVDWAPSENFKKWTFKLREDVFWSDGEPFSAEQVVGSFERLLNPKTGAMNTFLFHIIKNARAYNEGKSTDFAEVGVKRSGGDRVIFELSESASYFPTLLALFNVMPVRKDLIKIYEEDWLSPENFVTLGPYLLSVWNHDEKIILSSNEKYFRGKPKIRHIEFLIVKEEVTAINLYDQGRLDMVSGLPLEQVSFYREKEGFHTVQDLAIEYFGFNTRVAPFDDKRMRQAFSHLVDRSQIVNMFDAGFEKNSSLMPHGLEGWKSSQGLKHDRAKAMELMQEAGFSDLSQLPTVTLSYYTNSNQRRLIENVQEQIRTSIGVRPEVNNSEWKTYLAQVNSSKPPQVFRIGWMALYPDASMLLGLFTSDSHFNTSGWSDPRYDELVSKIRSMEMGAERQSHIDEALDILLNDHAVIMPLYTGARHYLVSPKLKNFPLNSMNRIRFH